MALMRAARHAAIAVMALTASTNPAPTQLEVRARRTLRADPRICDRRLMIERMANPATGAEFHNWVRCATGGVI